MKKSKLALVSLIVTIIVLVTAVVLVVGKDDKITLKVFSHTDSQKLLVELKDSESYNGPIWDDQYSFVECNMELIVPKKTEYVMCHVTTLCQDGTIKVFQTKRPVPRYEFENELPFKLEELYGYHLISIEAYNSGRQLLENATFTIANIHMLPSW